LGAPSGIYTLAWRSPANYRMALNADENVTAREAAGCETTPPGNRRAREGLRETRRPPAAFGSSTERPSWAAAGSGAAPDTVS